MQSEELQHLRHSLAHLLAAAVLDLYPDAKRTIGPAIEDGFYYDFAFAQPISEADLPKIEAKMRALIPTFTEFARKEVSADEARRVFADNNYKLELIDEFSKDGATLTLYTSGNYVDLCRGGHADSLVGIDPECFTLTKLAGAYWRGDEKNDQLTRVYGVAFATKAERDAHLAMLEEAKKRDHRKLGAELDLFAFDDDVGPGLPLWLPKGTAILQRLEALAMDTEAKAGYVRVRTPHIAKDTLYLTSGHLPYYKDSMFPPMSMDGETYYLKAMNCPHHHKLFAARPHSYRDLPLRYAEYGTCYRYEDSGSLFGLMRVRSLQMNDAHIYCTPEQFRSEFLAVIDLYKYYFALFGIEKFQMRLSKHAPDKLGEKYVNEPELWQQTEAEVRAVLQESGVPFFEAEDEAAFYGPKIDVQIWSAIGREFTLSTNQLDFAVPKRFGLEYVGADGEKKTPICIHRAPLSTHERFIGFLIEHYAGAFPMWLAPEQVRVATVGEEFVPFAKELMAKLEDAGMRAHLDDSNEKVGKKIRNAATAKVPWTVVVGAKEVEGGDFKANVFGQEDDLVIPQAEFVARAQDAARLP